MVKVGLAEVYRGKPAPGFDNAPYQEVENLASSAGRGMWSLGNNYIRPKDWRKMHSKGIFTCPILISISYPDRTCNFNVFLIVTIMARRHALRGTLFIGVTLN